MDRLRRDALPKSAVAEVIHGTGGLAPEPGCRAKAVARVLVASRIDMERGVAVQLVKDMPPAGTRLRRGRGPAGRVRLVTGHGLRSGGLSVTPSTEGLAQNLRAA